MKEENTDSTSPKILCDKCRMDITCSTRVIKDGGEMCVACSYSDQVTFAMVDNSIKFIPEQLTKRETFAAMAMQGLLASSHHNKREELAEDSYSIADAMIKRREE